MSFRIRVIDGQGEPLPAATVTLLSGSRAAITDGEGMVIFEDVLLGQHELNVSYNDQRSDQSIYLQGNNQNFDVTLQLGQAEAGSGSLDAVALVVAGVLVVLIFVLGRRYVLSRR